MTKIVTLHPLDEGIVQLKFDDPEQDNRFTDAFVDQFLTALSTCAKDPSLKVLLLTGRHDVFAGGASLEVLQQLLRGDTEVKDLLLPVQLLNFPVPVIAAMTGHAVGGGLLMTAAMESTLPDWDLPPVWAPLPYCLL